MDEELMETNLSTPDKCENTTKTVDPLIEHQKDIHKCPGCDYITSVLFDLERHLKENHNVRYYCNQCNYKASSTSDLIEHRKSNTCGVVPGSEVNIANEDANLEEPNSVVGTGNTATDAVKLINESENTSLVEDAALAENDTFEIDQEILIEDNLFKTVENMELDNDRAVTGKATLLKKRIDIPDGKENDDKSSAEEQAVTVKEEDLTVTEKKILLEEHSFGIVENMNLDNAKVSSSKDILLAKKTDTSDMEEILTSYIETDETNIAKLEQEDPLMLDHCYTQTDATTDESTSNLSDPFPEHAKDIVLKCPGCDYKTSKQAYLALHLKVNHNFKYQCNKCKYEASSARELIEHSKSRHVCRCDQCHYITDSEVKLMRHKSEMHNGWQGVVDNGYAPNMHQNQRGLYPCDRCDYRTTQPGDLKHHITRMHNSIDFQGVTQISALGDPMTSRNLDPLTDSKRNPYPCDQCAYTGTTPYSLKMHKGSSHNTENQAGKLNFTIYDHSLKTSYQPVTILQRNPYPCDLCSYTGMTPSCLKTHKQESHNSKNRQGTFGNLSTAGIDNNLIVQSTKPEVSLYNGGRFRTLAPRPPHLTQQMSIEKIQFPCFECSYAAPTVFLLEKHLSDHYVMDDFLEREPKMHVKRSCDQCDFVGSHLKKHKERFHATDTLPCDQCDYVGDTKSDLYKHQETKHRNNIFKCNDCSYITITRKHLERHVYRKHAETYNCDLCPYTCALFNELKRHKKTEHTESRPPNRRYRVKTKAKKSKSTAGAGQTEKRRFHCDRCDFSATTKNYLIEHERSKHEGVKYPCDQCDFVTTMLSTLRSHIISKHGEIRFVCDQCDFTATLIKDFKYHMATRHSDVKHKCDQCDYTTTNKYRIKIHKKIKHEGFRLFCDQCDYQATRKSYLKRHQEKNH